MVLVYWAASCIIYIKVVSTRLLTSKGIMYINPIDLVWLLIVKLGAVQSTYMAKFAMTSWKLKTVRSISCAFPATYRVGCMTRLHSPKSKQMLGAAGGKSYTYIWWSFDFKPFLLNNHYCKEYEGILIIYYFYIILIFEWSQAWVLASPFLGKL